MIGTVYLNPTIDRTIYLDRLCVGGTNRPNKVVVDGAGKAVNVAIVLSALGAEQVKCLGYVCDQDSQILLDRLAGGGISHDFLVRKGASRTNTKIFDGQRGEITEINESGQQVDQQLIQQAIQLVEKYASQCEYLVFAGSLPPGAPKSLYRDMIQIASQQGARCILDAEGQALELGLAAKPYLIKPNIDELNMLLGTEVKEIPEILQACRQIIQGGVSVVAVSMGGKGALICDGQEAYQAQPLSVEVRSTVGAGDSMVAGMVYGFQQEGGLEEALRIGVACASGSITLEGTQLVNREIFEELYPQIKIQKI